MNHLQQVQRAVDFIEEHLKEDLSVDAIAKEAGFSKWHFQMVFSSAVGDTLKEYIRKRRLTASMIEITTTDKRLLDIAMDAGFESQEAFTRAFKTMFQMTPGECRRVGSGSIMSLNKPRITMEYLDHLYGGMSMTPIIREIAEKKVVGMGAKFISALSPDRNNEIVIGRLWSEFNPRSQEISARLSKADLGVVVCVTEEKAHPNECYYFAGAEVSSMDVIPDKMTALIIPAGNYAVFTHRGSLDKIAMTMKYIYGSWLPKSGRKLRDAPEIEVYDHRFNPGSDASEFDIYIPVV